MDKQTYYHKHTLARRVITVVLSFMMVFTMMPLLSPELFQASAAGCTGGSWSGWSTTMPASNAKYESRTEYRYSDKNYISSSSSSLQGWTRYDSTYSVSWGSWSGWSTTARSKNETTDVETRTVNTYKTQYNYDRWASNSNNTGHLGPWQGTWSGVACNYHFTKGWSDTRLSYNSKDDQTATRNGTRVTFHLYGGSTNSWFNETTRQVVSGSRTEYRYRTGTKVYTYYFYKWGDWSGWSVDVPYTSSSRKIETRTTYRVWKPAAHKWDAGKITKASGYTHTGTKTYTCTVCGAHKSQTIAKRNAKAVTPAKPKLKSAKGSKGKVTMKWTKVAKNTKGYQIAIRDTSIGKTKYINVGQGKKKTVKSVIKKLTKKHTYLVKVRAYNKIGNETIYGPWSNGKAGKVK